MPNPRRREPIFQIPGVIVAMIAAMSVVQAAQSLAGEEFTLRLLRALAFVPGRWTAAFDPNGALVAIGRLSAAGRDEAAYFIGGGFFHFWTPLTYAIVHAGWVHLAANSVWFVAFGAPVARRLGSWRFILLFCIAAIGGAAAHWVTHIFDFVPVVGASAGISGVMAAAARFIFQPGGPIDNARGERTPALSVVRCFTDGRALAFIAIWFGVNLAIGLAAQPLGISAAPVAWQAHIGGFAVGLFAFSLFDRPGPDLEQALRQDLEQDAGEPR